MTNPPRFEGLAEDKITWHSNSKMPRLIGQTVWEAEEITGFSNIMPFSYPRLIVLEAKEITRYSNLKTVPSPLMSLEKK